MSEVSGAAGPDVPDERAAKGSGVPAGVREATAARLAQAEGKPFELMSDWLKDVWLEEADAFLAELVPNLTSTIIQEYDADNESLAIANAGLATALERAEADADARVAAAVSGCRRDQQAALDELVKDAIDVRNPDGRGLPYKAVPASWIRALAGEVNPE